MKSFFTILLFLLLFFGEKSLAQWQVASPNGKVRANLLRTNDGKFSYTVDFIENSVVTNIVQTSPLGITRNDQDFTANLTVEMVTNQAIDDRYTMLTGKQSLLWNHANEITINCKNANNAKLQIIFRVYDDGVAFRYRFTDNSTQNVNIIGENTGFAIPTGGKGWLSKNTSQPDYQQYYVETPIGNNAPDNFGWNFPALFQSNNFWYLISESGLDGNSYAAHLSPTATNGVYKIQLPDQGDGNDFNAFTTSTLPFSMPWRLIILGKNLSDIVESNLVNHLADSSKITNTSWIKPGISSWSWWSDFSSPTDYNKLKSYVDFSKAQGLPYTLVDDNWNLMTGGDLSQLAQYAQNQGVGLWVWYNSAGQNNNIADGPRDLMSNPATRQAEMLKLKNLGVKGIKVDYFLSDKQAVIKLYLEILKDAANYQLMVNFHGCTIPRGWQRTYPNLLGMEAVAGDEQLLFNLSDFRSNSPAHNVNLVFTRNIIGSMDYTPTIIGTERVTHNTTTAHELALLALFESGITHWADNITNYQALNSTVLKAISQIPTAWDETHLLQGSPNKYAFVARKKGDDWYIAGINGSSNALSTHFGIPYLDLGSYSKTIIADGNNARSLSISEGSYTYGQEETINLQPYGGFLIILKKAPCSLTKPIITKTDNTQGSTLSINTTSKNIQWLLNRAEISGATSSTYSPLKAGNYVVRISDANCTVVSDEITINVEKPIITIIGKNPACVGDSIQLQVTQSYDQLKWYLDDVDLNVNSNSYITKKLGTYKVIGTKLKIDSDFSDALTIVFNPLPQKPVITQEASVLKANSLSNIQWIFNGEDISGAIGNSYNPTKEGNYSIRATNLNGCFNISDIYTFRFDKPTITIIGKNPACEGDSVMLSAPLGYDKYMWYWGSDSLASQFLIAKKSGFYKVVGIKNSLIKSDSLQVVFNAYPAKPQISINQNNLSSSSSTGNQWYANGSILTGETNQQLSNFTSKNYVVKVTINGCSTASDLFLITSLSTLYGDNIVNVYPNPTDGKIQITYSQALNVQFVLSDLNGKTLLEKTLKGNLDATELDLTNFHSGIYLLKISAEKWSSIKKIFRK